MSHQEQLCYREFDNLSKGFKIFDITKKFRDESTDDSPGIEYQRERS